MVETIINPHKEIEKIELDKSKPKKSKYKAFETMLQGKIQIARNIGDKEKEIILEEILDEYKKLFKTRDIIIEKIGFVRDGHTYNEYNMYKGFDNDFRVWIYGDETPIVIDKEKVNYMLSLILNLKVNQHYPAKYFFNKIIENYGLNLNNDEFAGGKNRASVYFPLYLFPAKIIEKELGIIKVIICRGGGITRLR